MTGSVLSAGLAALLTLGLVFNGVRLRRRLSVLPVLSPSERPCDARFAIGHDVRLDDATRRAAGAYAWRADRAVLDLIPADLSVEPALDLIRGVNPKTYPTDRLVPGRGTGHVTLVDPAVAERAGLTKFKGLDAGEFVRFVEHIKHYATASAGLAVAPTLRAVPYNLAKRRAYLEATEFSAPISMAVPALVYALLVASAVANPVWGAAAVLAYCLQPYLIFSGGPVRPRGLHAAALLRMVREPYVWVRTVSGTWRSAVDIEVSRQIEDARAMYSRELAEGTDRFLEPRRDSCPWCGSGALAVLVRTGDHVLRKPGTFALERCHSCGHVFQNPRLSLAGLDFYYRDFYDGLNVAQADKFFRVAGGTYRERALMVAPFTTPKSWLDVGAGHAHFCSYAQDIWPETTFDGLDLGSGIEEAQRRGWISRAYRGLFPDLADELAGCYDVVSMHHYLEHTRDPYAELDAAAKVLIPGGHLLIEVPDPEWPLARVCGRFWVPWLQPQHQHLAPFANMKQALADRGLVLVAEDRAAAHLGNDLICAFYLRLLSLTPDTVSPWSKTRTTFVGRLRSAVVWTTGAPILVLCVVADAVINWMTRRNGRRGNSYRILARKDDDCV